MKEEKRNTILEMMKDYLYYGYGFNSFLEHKYEIAKSFTEDELFGMWKQAKSKIGSDL